MRKIVLAGVSVVFMVQNALGTEFWIVSDRLVSKSLLESTKERFRNLFKDKDVEVLSSHDFLLRHPVTEDEMATILQLDGLARAASLNGRFSEAYAIYSKLENRLKDIPTVAGLEVIRISAKVNMAQLSSVLKKPNAEALWKDAHAFAPESSLSPEEFSPATIFRFNKPAKIPKRVMVEVRGFENAEVYVDGYNLKGSKFVHLEPGHHQANAIGPGLQWTTQNFEVKPSTPMKIMLSPSFMIGGTCDSPTFKGAKLPPGVNLLSMFNKNCIKIYGDGKWFSIKGSGGPNQTAQISEDLKPSGVSEPSLSLKSSEPHHPGIFKSPWFWAGIGAAVAAIVITTTQTTTVPTHASQ